LPSTSVLSRASPRVRSGRDKLAALAVSS
jgi:hypothetical protein